ncbi:MAG: cation diffusion facilitator family transporter [Prolixibacteraceae bacterium]|jgi:cation diffusion facilitator family transporter|nr:cation diffusion facilitator family transporter [Prolixibacteraceae bacterium]
MSGHSGSVKAVVFALGSNILITIIKFIVSAVTHSAGMLAESIHSFADCGNQVFLLIGNKRSAKPATEQHPFGYGKEEYFWGFLVAVLLFFVGAAFSIYEGVHKLFNPVDLQNISWSFIVLIVSILLEGKSFHVAYTAFKNTNKGIGIYKALKESTDTNLFVILLEDSAALIGLTLVLISTALAWFVHPVFDAIGSILVGILLVTISLFMINELRKLIVGENISKELRREFEQTVMANSVIHQVNYISAMMMGKGKFMLVIGVDLENKVSASLVEDQFRKIRNELHNSNDSIHSIYFDVKDLVREAH